jgi:hypothetical protein
VEGKGTTTEPQEYSYNDNINGISATEIQYRLKQVDFNGQFTYSDVVIVDNIAPLEFRLDQNYPNPFNPSTIIKYSLPSAQFVTLKVFDILGNEVIVLVNNREAAGNYQVEFNAEALPSGVYYYTLVTESFIQTKKMILLK